LQASNQRPQARPVVSAQPSGLLRDPPDWLEDESPIARIGDACQVPSDSLDRRPERVELLSDAVVAAFEMMNIVNKGISIGHQGRDHQGGRST